MDRYNPQCRLNNKMPRGFDALPNKMADNEDVKLDNI